MRKTKVKNEKQQKTLKKLKTKISGITLIALVITIVVLLILVGVSIAILTGPNGILTQANDAKENTRGGEVKETIDMAINENVMLDYTNGNKKNKQDVINKLIAEKKLTDEEVNILKTEDIIKIGNIEVDFSKLNNTMTIGQIYNEKIMDGTAINYTSNTSLPSETEWVIFGKDENGNILLTTSKPIENNFTVNATVQGWLTYEDDLNNMCSGYGATIQGKDIKSRSITIEDINRVSGFVVPTFEEYIFGSESDFTNKKVTYYHPDVTTENKWSKTQKTYEQNIYVYNMKNNPMEYGYYQGTEWIYTGYPSTLNHKELIVGENYDYSYWLATKSVKIDSDFADFEIGAVGSGQICTDNVSLCYGYSDKFGNNEYTVDDFIRPIVDLPSNIEVEEINGQWSIIY